MASNTNPIPEPANWALTSGWLRWSQGSVVLQRGTEYTGDERLLLERPELFGTKHESRRPQVRRVDCHHCRHDFIPGTGSGSDAQYCGVKCRRDRERLLARAARFVSRRSWPSIPNSASDLAEFERDVRGYIGLCYTLVMHLGGRLEAGAPAPEVDLAVIKDRLGRPLKLSDKQALLDLAYRAHAAMYDLLNDTTRASEAAMYAEQRQADSDRIWAMQQAGEQRRAGLADQWADKLGDGDASVAADLAALEQIR